MVESMNRDSGIIITVKEIMTAKKVRCKEIANAAGITQQSLSIIRSGKIVCMRFSTFGKLCKALNCQLSDLIRYKTDTVNKSIEKMLP